MHERADGAFPLGRRSLGMVVWLLLGLGGMGVLLYPILLLPAMVMVLTVLALLEIAHHVEGRGVSRRAVAAGTPRPVLLWGKLVAMAGACPTADRLSAGQTFVVAWGRVWPSICIHADRAILDTARSMESDPSLPDQPIHYHDDLHNIQMELYRVAPSATPVRWATPEDVLRTLALMGAEPEPSSTRPPKAGPTAFPRIAASRLLRLIPGRAWRTSPAPKAPRIQLEPAVVMVHGVMVRRILARGSRLLAYEAWAPEESLVSSRYRAVTFARGRWWGRLGTYTSGEGGGWDEPQPPGPAVTRAYELILEAFPEAADGARAMGRITRTAIGSGVEN